MISASNVSHLSASKTANVAETELSSEALNAPSNRSSSFSHRVKRPSSNATQVASEQIDSGSATFRASSKRSAAQAAQKSIERSFAKFPDDEDGKPTHAHKKLRPSGSSRSKPEPKVSASDTTARLTSTLTALPRSRTTTASSPLPTNRGRRFKDDQGGIWELQLGGCSTALYNQWRKCVQCVAKKAGDTCRFSGFRAFPIDPTTDELSAASTSGSSMPAFITSLDADDIMDLPSTRPLSPDSLLTAHTNVAKSLLPILEAELLHAQQPETLRRPRETTCRQMCDFCATSIFSASWYCRRCGREYCPDCKDAMKQGDDLDRSLAKRLALCDRIRGHGVADLIPLTRFDTTLLKQELVAMQRLLADAEQSHPELTAKASDTVTTTAEDHVPGSDEDEGAAVKWTDIPHNRVGLTADNIIGSLPLRVFDATSFGTDIFQEEWSHGEPLLVRNVTGPMQNTWGPDDFISRYGEESCYIIRSDVDLPPQQEVSVSTFFATFGQDDAAKESVLGQGSWKLKDWPPSADFKAEFPELYNDFNRAVPAPEYTTREGVLNLGSCYPTGVIQPDLGPKMYNAWRSSEGVDGSGSTRLHMDIADAVNIMLYASPPTGEDVPEEHRPGVAAWDIFRAEDADSLRAFLREEYAKLKFQDDPIHIQRFFISAPQRVKLWKRYGVKSWRIYQRAGEAVFIPAGCAHQVCNLTDCVKVAVDFVSPQNVERCFKLTAEFRELLKDYKRAWKEDVLSLRTTLWYAWCTYREMANKGPNVWAKEQQSGKTEEAITKKVVQYA